jgi:hypothetical protein
VVEEAGAGAGGEGGRRQEGEWQGAHTPYRPCWQNFPQRSAAGGHSRCHCRGQPNPGPPPVLNTPLSVIPCSLSLSLRCIVKWRRSVITVRYGVFALKHQEFSHMKEVFYTLRCYGSVRRTVFCMQLLPRYAEGQNT